MAELGVQSSSDPCSPTDLVAVAPKFAYMLELMNCNAVTFINSDFSLFTFPDFDIIMKKLLVSKFKLCLSP